MSKKIDHGLDDLSFFEGELLKMLGGRYDPFGSSLTASARHGPQTAMTFEKFKETLENLETLKPKDEWILIDPQGRAWKGTFNQTLRHLAAQHPFCKTNPFPPKMDQET